MFLLTFIPGLAICRLTILIAHIESSSFRTETLRFTVSLVIAVGLYSVGETVTWPLHWPNPAGSSETTAKKSHKNPSFVFAEGFQDSSKVTDTAAGDGLRIGIERKDLHGEGALVAILAQRFQNRGESRFSEPRPLPLR